jgi:hypothetical protein
MAYAAAAAAATTAAAAAGTQTSVADYSKLLKALQSNIHGSL